MNNKIMELRDKSEEKYFENLERIENKTIPKVLDLIEEYIALGHEPANRERLNTLKNILDSLNDFKRKRP